MMVSKAEICAISGKRYRVRLDNRVSSLIPRIKAAGAAEPDEFALGQEVLVVFFGDGLADGVVLGVVDA